MTPTIGATLRQARELRQLSAVEAARAATISAAYLSRLENDAVKKPSPLVLHQLSEALGLPYAELMRLSGYRVPGASATVGPGVVGAALFADITEEEKDELVAYLAWYRTRRRAKATAVAFTGGTRRAG
jgi:transcriptional regulator with XRE-family HTH domain